MRRPCADGREALGTRNQRIDPQNLPEGFVPADWPKWTDGYAVQSNRDWGGCHHERGEIFDTVRDNGITGFAILTGDLHSFWASYASKSLPPHGSFEPVGVSVVCGSITSPGRKPTNTATSRTRCASCTSPTVPTAGWSRR